MSRKERVMRKVAKTPAGQPVVCGLCGRDGLNNLTIGHPNGDGGLHRQAWDCTAGEPFYRELERRNYASEWTLQVQCFGCNLTQPRPAEPPGPRPSASARWDALRARAYSGQWDFFLIRRVQRVYRWLAYKSKRRDVTWYAALSDKQRMFLNQSAPAECLFGLCAHIDHHDLHVAAEPKHRRCRCARPGGQTVDEEKAANAARDRRLLQMGRMVDFGFREKLIDTETGQVDRALLHALDIDCPSTSTEWITKPGRSLLAGTLQNGSNGTHP
jgi:hypothetical protein